MHLLHDNSLVTDLFGRPPDLVPGTWYIQQSENGAYQVPGTVVDKNWKLYIIFRYMCVVSLDDMMVPVPALFYRTTVGPGVPGTRRYRYSECIILTSYHALPPGTRYQVPGTLVPVMLPVMHCSICMKRCRMYSTMYTSSLCCTSKNKIVCKLYMDPWFVHTGYTGIKVHHQSR